MTPPRSRILLALTLAYPPGAHLALETGHPRLAAALLLVLMACLLTLRTRLPFALAAVGGALALAAWLPAAPLLLYLPPILIPLGLAYLFGRSLRPGRRPLVTAFAEEVMGEREPDRRGYTRAVTWLWTGVFIALVVESTLLALSATPATWSLFANLLNYLLIGAVFVLEFLWRAIHFRTRPAPLAFVRALLAADWRRLGR